MLVYYYNRISCVLRRHDRDETDGRDDDRDARRYSYCRRAQTRDINTGGRATRY